MEKRKFKDILVQNRFFLPHIFLLILLYFLLTPILPEINFQLRKLFNLQYKEESLLLEKQDSTHQYAQTKGVAHSIEDITENSIIIPTVGIRAPVVEGGDDSALNKGTWRRPNSSTPDKGGNTVITGHRFHYIPPYNRTFYNLNKVEEGAKIFVFWEGKEYVYKVYKVLVIDPTDVDVEDNTQIDILTLYTCHPLWTAKQRLVVRAQLEEVKE